MKAAIFLIAILALSGIVMAEETVIIATDVTSVDALVASSAANNDGTPVLIAENGEITAEIENELEDQEVENVIIVGGPAVVSEQTANKLALKYKLARLWGIERTGTAIEVAKYFWPEGSECIVLVSDTKNSDMDTKIQLRAANYGAHKRCPIIPVPDGKIPAEVLSLMDELNVTTVYLVGTFTDEAKASLSAYTVVELTQDEIEDEILDDTTTTPKLVIIATPEWREATTVGSLPLGNTIVRMVSNVNELDPIVALIKEKNISEVKVVGKPALAQEIASALEAQGITVDKISGEHASEMARLAWLRTKIRWAERKIKAVNERAQEMQKIKERLKEWKEKAADKLDDDEIEADSLSNSAVSSALKVKITEVKATLTTIQNNIDQGNIDEAKRLISELQNKIETVKWQNRAVVASAIQQSLQNEEQTSEEIQSSTGTNTISSRITALRNCANPATVRAVVEEAKKVRAAIQDAKDQGDIVLVAKLAIRERNLVQIANKIADICENKGNTDVDPNAVIGRQPSATSVNSQRP